MIVVDTNVLIYATNQTEISHDATRILAVGGPTISPVLWHYEYLAVITKEIRLGRLDAEAGMKAYEDAIELIMVEEDQFPSREIFALSKRYAVTGYDAVFVHWALYYRIPLVTFDKRLIASAKGIAVLPGDYLARL